MIYRFLLILLAVCLVNPVWAEIYLKGKMANYTKETSWKPYVYLYEIQKIDQVHGVGEANFIDSFKILDNGLFRIPKLKPHSVYKITVGMQANTATHQLIQNGVSDNYAFIVTNDGADQEEILFNASIDSLHNTYKVFSPSKSLQERNLALAEILSYRKNMSVFMRDMGILMESGANQDSIMQIVPMQMMQLLQKGDQLLLSFMEKSNDPLMIAFAASMLNMDDENNSGLVNRIYLNKKMTVDMHPLVENTYSKIIVQHDYKYLNNLNLTSITGEKLQISTIDKDYVLLDFWASWCTPCRQSIVKELIPLQKKLKDQLEIIGVITTDKLVNAKKAIEKDKIPFIQLESNEHNASIAEYFKVSNLPDYILINKKDGTLKRFKTSYSLINHLNQQ